MKSAEARLQAIGMFQTTAMRRSALTSGSCGCGSSGSQKKIRKSISSLTILAPICWSPPRGPLSKFRDRKAQLLFQNHAGGACRKDLMMRQEVAVVLGPLYQIRLLVVVRDQRDLLVVLHRDFFVIHVAPLAFPRGGQTLYRLAPDLFPICAYAALMSFIFVSAIS